MYAGVCRLQARVGGEAVAQQLDLHVLHLQGADQPIGQHGIVFDQQERQGHRRKGESERPIMRDLIA
ncbi:hypothetical protein GCM10027317_38410 [Massilia agri]